MSISLSSFFLDILSYTSLWSQNESHIEPIGESAQEVVNFLDSIEMKITRQNADKSELEFDIVGIEAPLANALRRIMIAEVNIFFFTHKIARDKYADYYPHL